MPGGGQPGNNNGGKGKPITDAIIASLHREVEEKDGTKTKRLYVLAQRLVDRAMSGDDLMAIREVLDRVEGKPKQSIDSDVEQTLHIIIDDPTK